MINKKELIKELKEKFEETKKKLAFKAEFDEIEHFFFLTDHILEQGYVSERFERQLCLRLISSYYSWMGEFHAWIMPPPGNIITHTEYKAFLEDEKEIVKFLIKKTMYFFRKDKLNAFKDDYKKMGETIDEMVEYREKYTGFMNKLLEKKKKNWEKELEEDKLNKE